jgi:hypothetical protein
MRIDLLGGEEMKEPNRLVALNAVSLELLTDRIVLEPTYPIRLSRLPNDHALVECLAEKFARAGWITRTQSMPYPYLTLSGDLVRKSMREDLRRARRRAAKRGELRVETLALKDNEQLLQKLRTAFRIEASGWKGRNGTAILSNPRRERFFRRYACWAQQEGVLRLIFQYIDDEPVAVQYAIESAGAFWLLNVGFDEAYRECSPGNLLLEESIRNAARGGLARYNFLGKEEGWVSRWSTHTQDTLVLAAYRPNLPGLRAMLSDALFLLNRKRQQRRPRHARETGAR